MLPDPTPVLRDPSRLATLHQLGLLDEPRHPAFERLTRLATKALRVPVALVCLVDADRQFFTSSIGLPEPWSSQRETPLSHSFCQYVVAGRAPLLVSDARQHPILRHNRAVPDLGVVAYAGVPLVSSDGYALGSYAVIDGAPRAWSDDDIELLRDLAAGVMTEFELRQLGAAALAASRAKSRFLAMMSHEIRTPLNAIIGMSTLLLDSTLSSEQHEYVATTERSGRALLNVIDELLDFSKIESGHLRIESHPFSLRDCISDAQALLAAQASAKNLSLNVHIASGVPPLLNGDSARIRQILLNLLGNALKFTSVGSISVEADSSDLGAGEHEIQLRVRDSGSGIPVEEQERIFEPFEQGDAGSARTHGGSGLGLAISQQLSALMGGQIAVASTPGQGSTFTLTLRLTAAQVAQPSARSNGFDRALAQRHPLTILLVEDNPINQRVGTLLLERLGYQPQVASDGAAALAALDEQAYDLVLMDIGLPDMDGVATMELIRQRPGPQPRIVALTAHAVQGDRERFLAAGMDAYLSKPIRIEELRALLAQG